MTQHSPQSWSPLHDLGLIYLSLMHGADAEIDPSEQTLSLERLKAWHPEQDEGRLKEVMAEVMLVYVGGSGRQMLDTSVVSLRHALPKGKRIAVLNDLADIASADGMIVPGEVSFIQQLARHWEVENDIQE